jgi:hypothetical protein
MRRSPVRSSARLRIAMGLVAAERSPRLNMHIREQREIALVMWFVVLFGLFHAVIFAILLGVAK